MSNISKIKRIRLKASDGIKEYVFAVKAKNVVSNDKNLETEINKIDNKVDKIEGKGLSDTNFTQAEKDKLAKIENNANNYVLPIASNTQLGGIKIGTGFAQLEDGTINITNKLYDETQIKTKIKEKANEAKIYQIVIPERDWIQVDNTYTQEIEVPYMISDGVGMADTLDKTKDYIKEYEKIIDIQTSLNKIILTAKEKPTANLQIELIIIGSNESPIYIGIYPLVKEIEFTDESPSKTIAIETNQKDFITEIQTDDLFNIVNNNNKSITISKKEKYGSRKIRINFNTANGYSNYNDIIVQYLLHAKGTELNKSLIKSNINSLTGTISFANKLSPTGEDYSLAKDSSVKCVIDGQNATISGDGGVLAPNDCSYMFIDSKATTLDVSNFDTSNVTNMFRMFEGSQATTLNLSNFDTSNVTNMESMFRDSKATTLDVSNFDTSNVTNMCLMFYNSQATTLDLSNFNTSNVINMRFMFADSKATTLNLSNFDTSNVTDMRYMFDGSQATTLNLSNFDTSNITDMCLMFYNSQATTLDLSNFDTLNVTDMSSMFADSKATTLDLSSFDTSNVTDMHSMFADSKATTLDLSSFNTSKVTNMDFMFSSCQATTLDLSSFDTSNVTDMESMFSNSQATKIYCRTEEDKQRFLASSNCTPNADKFIVGKP